MKCLQRQGGWYVRVKGIAGRPCGPGEPQEMGPFAARPMVPAGFTSVRFTAFEDPDGREEVWRATLEVNGVPVCVLACVNFHGAGENVAHYSGEVLLQLDDPLATQEATGYLFAS